MAKAAKADTEAEQQRQENYNRTVAVIDLSAIQLVKLDFDVSPEYYSHREEAELGYVVTLESSVYDSEEGFAACIVNFDVEAIFDDEALLSCKAKYTVMYTVAEECDEESVKAVLKRIGIFACYPYFRGVFANLDWSANTRLPPLPVHKENIRRKPKPRGRRKTPEATQSQDE